MKINGQSEIGRIRSILLKHPREAWIDQKHIDDQWRDLNYFGKPDYEQSLTEYDNFIAVLKSTVDDIHFLPSVPNSGLDSIYLHDPVVITVKGAILCNMGKAERAGEPEAVETYLKSINIPILGRISGNGRLEGGDIVWLNEKTLCVGEGYRTNSNGISQLKDLTSGLVDNFVVVPLPHWNGPGDVLHLMSMISPVDRNLAVIYPRMMPVRFREFLKDRGYRFVEVPDEEYDSMACNILALEPGKVLMLSGNPITKGRLIEQGAEVIEYNGFEISRKGAGGPTCLTRPLLREE